jgi:arylamine N-acetyltransferase
LSSTSTHDTVTQVSYPPYLTNLLTHCGFSISDDSPTLFNDLLTCFSRIPYENLSKIVRASENSGAPLLESPDDIISGFIHNGSGGTCFALTNSLCAALRALGFDASPILADRRYGQDTHCAVLCTIPGREAALIDPGYRIYSPCALPTFGHLRYELFLSTVELRASSPNLVELYTTSLDPADPTTLRYRLTYKTTPVGQDQLEAAWKRSFSWEMMCYPVLSAVREDCVVYLQKDALRVRSLTNSSRAILTDEQIVEVLATQLSLSRSLVQRALVQLKKR